MTWSSTVAVVFMLALYRVLTCDMEFHCSSGVHVGTVSLRVLTCDMEFHCSSGVHVGTVSLLTCEEY